MVSRFHPGCPGKQNLMIQGAELEIMHVSRVTFKNLRSYLVGSKNISDCFKKIICKVK